MANYMMILPLLLCYTTPNLACESCNAGSVRILSCSSVNAVCRACDRGRTFMPVSNERTECFPCRTDCDKRGQVIAYPCTEMQDSVCECKTGSYLQSDSDIACEPHTICPPGHGVAIAGTPTSDVKCEPCGIGTYSSLYSSIERCTPFTDCTFLGGVRNLGNNSMDNICHDFISSLKKTGLPAYGVPIIICVGVVVILALLFLIVYTVCQWKGKWNRFKEIVVHGPRNKREKFHTNNLEEVGNDQEDDQGSMQLIISKVNIPVIEGSSKLLNANVPSSFNDKAGTKDFSDFLEQSVDNGASFISQSSSINSGITFNNNNRDEIVTPSAPPLDDMSPSSNSLNVSTPEDYRVSPRHNI